MLNTHAYTNPFSAIFNRNTLIAGVMLSACAVLSGCQTTQSIGSTTGAHGTLEGNQTQPKLLEGFNIRGKIGVTTPQNETTNAQSGSAFYAWAQQDDRFSIDITGALGIGHTVIEYNGATATLVSERTGEISAPSPEELLHQATGWQAPISQLRYWISGVPAPSDENSELDNMGRLQTTHNAGWTATFTYKNNNAESLLPTKIKAVSTDGYRVIMTISHDSKQFN